MVELVDSLDLSTNVELLDSVVQVLNGRVFRVSAKDQLGFLLPKLGVKSTSLAHPRHRDPLSAKSPTASELRPWETKAGDANLSFHERPVQVRNIAIAKVPRFPFARKNSQGKEERGAPLTCQRGRCRR